MGLVQCQLVEPIALVATAIVGLNLDLVVDHAFVAIELKLTLGFELEHSLELVAAIVAAEQVGYFQKD